MSVPPSRRHCSARRAALGGALAALTVVAGCVSQQTRVQDTRQMLVAAGFVEKPATTAERQRELDTLPPFKVLRQPVQVNGRETFAYLYADPKYCHCILTGDARAYQAYQQMAEQQKIAREQLEAQELAQENAFNWDMWGPYGWGPGPVIVVHRHDDGHHH